MQLKPVWSLSPHPPTNYFTILRLSWFNLTLSYHASRTSYESKRYAEKSKVKRNVQFYFNILVGIQSKSFLEVTKQLCLFYCIMYTWWFYDVMSNDKCHSLYLLFLWLLPYLNLIHTPSQHSTIQENYKLFVNMTTFKNAILRKLIILIGET